jgi:hypothetical protein
MRETESETEREEAERGRERGEGGGNILGKQRGGRKARGGIRRIARITEQTTGLGLEIKRR